jgi:flagellar M-ring protein FliF
VQGMAQLIASSVERLTSDNVAVLDGTGKLLSTPTDAQGAVGLTSRQLEMQRAVEDQLADKIDDIVAQVVGEGEARVQVTAVLNFEQVDRTIEAFDPDGQVIETEQRSEQPTGSATTPSTISNNRFQNSRRIDRIVGAVGGITRLTVAVLVNERALLQSDQSGAGSVQVRLANLEALVRDAVGIDQARGDRLTIAAIPFEEVVIADLGPMITDTPPSGGILLTVERFARPAVALLGILAAFVLAWRVLKAVPRLAAATIQESLPAASPQAMSEAPAPAPQAQIPVVPATQADSAARVMRAWLAEPSA